MQVSLQYKFDTPVAVLLMINKLLKTAERGASLTTPQP